jgi:sec-independent protein translocase protein TatA
MSPILAFWESPPQLILVAFIALLLFGKRLPELMRSLGKGITEFKKGMNGIEEELTRGGGGGNNSNYNNNPNYNSNNYLPPPTYHESGRPLPTEERPEITAPKFQPPTAAPTPPATHIS